MMPDNRQQSIHQSLAAAVQFCEVRIAVTETHITGILGHCSQQRQFVFVYGDHLATSIVYRQRNRRTMRSRRVLIPVAHVFLVFRSHRLNAGVIRQTLAVHCTFGESILAVVAVPRFPSPVETENCLHNQSLFRTDVADPLIADRDCHCSDGPEGSPVFPFLFTAVVFWV